MPINLKRLDHHEVLLKIKTYDGKFIENFSLLYGLGLYEPFQYDYRLSKGSHIFKNILYEDGKMFPRPGIGHHVNDILDVIFRIHQQKAHPIFL